MKRSNRTILGAAAIAAFMCATVALTATAQDAGRVVAPAGDEAVAPETAPRGIGKLLHAQPFTVDTPFASTWRADRPEVSGGWLLVFEADDDLLRPRQTAAPVLMAGDQTAIRINVGYDSGRLVVLVPTDMKAGTRPAVGLDRLPIWFGSPELPERVTPEWIRAERARAVRAGVEVRPAAERAAAVRAGGKAVRAANELALRQAAMRLVKRYSPDESELADSWLNLPAPAGS